MDFSEPHAYLQNLIYVVQAALLSFSQFYFWQYDLRGY